MYKKARKGTAAVLKIESIKLTPGQDMGALTAETARILKVREKDLRSLKVLRRSIDARKGEVSVVYTVEAAVKDEPTVLKRCHNKKVARAERKPGYLLPAPLSAPEIPPVVVGAGPAGLFAALVLARAGLRPILLERGRPVEQRKADVDRFWSTGELDLTSNVQFGEGGAGAFSDGKLNTGTKDIRHRFILETLVSHGAPEDILIDAKPHVGTDYLHVTLQTLRRDLLALGADIRQTEDGRLRVRPIEQVPSGLCHLHCGESGSTLRFLLPVCGALGADAVFHMEGRLPQRPLAPLDAELTAHGMALRQENDLLYCSGQLRAGDYALPGNVSSQYISGLLLALPLTAGDSRLSVTGSIESEAYITMTEDALALAGIALEKSGWRYHIPGSQRGKLPEALQVEGDFSNAAFFLCMGALSDAGLVIDGLNPASHQGDRAVLDILRAFGATVEQRESSFAVCKD